MARTDVPVTILGATGYVGGEVLRLVALHPDLRLAAAVSRSAAGSAIGETFPHLAGVYEGTAFVDADAVAGLLAREPELAVFSCLPHGEAAAGLDRLLRDSDQAGCRLHLVDLSADFRLGTPDAYRAVYGGEHGAPDRMGSFLCALPDLTRERPDRPVAHPGCFTTASVLAAAPAWAGGLVEPVVRISAVTGSTGSGRSPSPTTHHPERHGNLRAYRPYQHRHAPEMRQLLGRVGPGEPEVLFVPHSGPFARGIHATVQLDLVRPMSKDGLHEVYADFYRDSLFVRVQDEPPAIKDVVGTNRCVLSVYAEGSRAVVLSVIDNLTKGAAGGAVQWMNRLLGLEEGRGLTLPGWGWS